MMRLRRERSHLFVLGGIILLTTTSCSRVPPAQKEPLTQQRLLSALLQTAAYPNSDVVVVLATMQQLTASHREWEGYEYFGRLARDQPARAPFFRALQAADRKSVV